MTPRRRWFPDPFRRFAPPASPEAIESDAGDEADAPPREFTAEERAIQRRARLQVLLIGGLAGGGIVCMAVTVALVLWSLSR